MEFGADYYISLYLDAKQFITAIMNLQALFASDEKEMYEAVLGNFNNIASICFQPDIKSFKFLSASTWE